MLAKHKSINRKLRKQLKSISQADIVVGIPSFNNYSTIGHVVDSVSAGILNHFPDSTTVIVNSDGGSSDGTPAIVMDRIADKIPTVLVDHPIYTVHKISALPIGIPGKGSAFKTIFRIAEILGAKAVVVIEADLRSISSEWVELLLSPILNNYYDFVSPLYQRHKYDGAITNSIVYPLTRALYGRPVRQPIGGEFAFSGQYVKHLLETVEFDSDIARHGIDIWVTTTAIGSHFRICQSYLGSKVYESARRQTDLSWLLTQVVTSLFYLMEKFESNWWNIDESLPVPEYGKASSASVEPVYVDLEGLVGGFRRGIANLIPVWRKFLGHECIEELEVLSDSSVTSFSFPADLWVRIVYEFALAYHHRVMHPEHLIKSLTPIYLGWNAGFVNKSLNYESEEVEEIIEDICLEFARQKSFLKTRWR